MRYRARDLATQDISHIARSLGDLPQTTWSQQPGRDMRQNSLTTQSQLLLTTAPYMPDQLDVMGNLNALFNGLTGATVGFMDEGDLNLVSDDVIEYVDRLGGPKMTRSEITGFGVSGTGLNDSMAPGGGTPGLTPIMQRPRLTAQQMADWFNSNSSRANGYSARVSVRELAQLYVEEGNIEGIAGDIAFAQASLETGGFSYPSYGQVRAHQNNYAGIGACDGGVCTVVTFATPRMGVRGQIHHLKAYADPNVTASSLRYPVASPRFDEVQPKGRAPNWEDMGGTRPGLSGVNWASDPEYSTKILNMYDSMLAVNGMSRAPSSAGAVNGVEYERFRIGPPVIGRDNYHRRDTPNTRVGIAAVRRLGFSGQIISYAPRGSEHSAGRAIDVMVGHGTAQRKSDGDKVADFFIYNREPLKVQHVIWYQRIAGPQTNWAWRDMENRGSITANHKDHPHIYFRA